MSTYERIRQFLDRYVVQIGSIIVLLAVASAIASAFFDPLSDFLVNQRVYEVLIIALLIDLMTRLVDMGSVPPLRLKKDQSDAMPVLIENVRRERPETVKMFEYSAATVRDLLKELRQQEVTIKLLMFDPEASPINETQTSIIQTQLKQLKSQILRNYDKVEIRLYSYPASLRGRRIGDLLNLGWYTYYHHEDETNLVGDVNPMLIISATNTPEAKALAKMFDEAFDDAWQNSRQYNL